MMHLSLIIGFKLYSFVLEEYVPEGYGQLNQDENIREGNKIGIS